MSAPVAVTFRIRPPFVTTAPSCKAVPAWKTRAPVASAASIPVIGTVYGLLDVLLIFRASRRCLHDNIADTIVVTA